MVPAMRRSRTIFVVASAWLGCAGSSGVASNKTLASLTRDEYASVCKYFNDKSQAMVGQTCASTQQKVVHVMRIDCTTNPFTDTMCEATVSDVESCVSKTDVCAALPNGRRPAECSKIAMCVGGGS
jgi:hypothetical protein